MDLAHLRHIGLNLESHTFDLRRCGAGAVRGRGALAAAGGCIGDAGSAGYAGDTSKVGRPARAVGLSTKCSSIHDAASRLAVGKSPAPKGQPARLLKILCLHGSVQSAAILEDRLRNLLKKAAGLARFVFVDGPHLQGEGDGEGQKRCWWRAGERPDEPHPEWAAQWQLSRQVIASALDEACASGDPFDGVLGFSNGAAVAAMVLAEAARGVPALNENCSALRFGILCSGYRPDALRDIDPLSGFATLHVFGESDPLVSRQQTDDLLALFSNPRPLQHEMLNAKHHVPSRSQDVNSVCEFLRQQHRG